VLAVTELETTSSFRAIVIISIFTTSIEQRDSLGVFICEIHCVTVIIQVIIRISEMMKVITN